MSENHDPSLSPQAYWKASIRIVLAILTVWFCVSYGCSILLRDWLDANAPAIGGAPFGFWMSQQGSIAVFLLLLLVYRKLMNNLDKKFNYDEGENS